MGVPSLSETYPLILSDMTSNSFHCIDETQVKTVYTASGCSSISGSPIPLSTCSQVGSTGPYTKFSCTTAPTVTYAAIELRYSDNACTTLQSTRYMGGAGSKQGQCVADGDEGFKATCSATSISLTFFKGSAPCGGAGLVLGKTENLACVRTPIVFI